MVFSRDNPKTPGTKSYWRYEHYKVISCFDDFDSLCKTKAVFNGQRAFRNRVIDMDPVVIPKASKSDLVNDYKHGYLTFSNRPILSASSSAQGLVSQYLEENVSICLHTIKIQISVPSYFFQVQSHLLIWVLPC